MKFRHINNYALTSYEKGIAAESIATQKIQSIDFAIIDRRIKTTYGEIDILAIKDDCVVAFEIKQRKTILSARDCLTDKQKHRIAKAFLYIITKRNKIFENYRIDVIYLDSSGRSEHIENAFYIEDFISY